MCADSLVVAGQEIAEYCRRFSKLKKHEIPLNFFVLCMTSESLGKQ